jgi:hypothetical protein
MDGCLAGWRSGASRQRVEPAGERQLGLDICEDVTVDPGLGEPPLGGGMYLAKQVGDEPDPMVALVWPELLLGRRPELSCTDAPIRNCTFQQEAPTSRPETEAQNLV